MQEHEHPSLSHAESTRAARRGAAAGLGAARARPPSRGGPFLPLDRLRPPPLPRPGGADPAPGLGMPPADAASRGLGDGEEIRVFNERGEMRARAFVTGRIPPGTVWMRDGWAGLNTLTSGAPVLPDTAVDLFGFSGGQADFEAGVQSARA